jgi:hypothetical protein
VALEVCRVSERILVLRHRDLVVPLQVMTLVERIEPSALLASKQYGTVILLNRRLCSMHENFS